MLARFPELSQLPAASDLRQLLQDMGHRVDVVTGPDGAPRYETPGGTLVAPWSSTRGPSSAGSGGGRDEEAWLRLRSTAERGGFLVVKTWLTEWSRDAPSWPRSTRSPPCRWRLFVSGLREIVAERGKPRWETVLVADSAGAPPNAQSGFRRLVEEVWERIAAQVRAAPGLVLLSDATPLARYPGGWNCSPGSPRPPGRPTNPRSACGCSARWMIPAAPPCWTARSSAPRRRRASYPSPACPVSRERRAS